VKGENPVSLFATSGRRLVGLAAVAVGVTVGLAQVGTAGAVLRGTMVSVALNTLTVESGPALANHMSITHASGDIVVNDTVSLTAGTGCRALLSTRVACAAKLVVGIDVSVGDLSDEVTYSGALMTTMTGGAGNDTLTGGHGSDSLDGGAGDDTLSSGGGKDLLVGDLGADTLTGGTGDDRLYGDRVTPASACLSMGSPGCQDKMYGGDGNDGLYGGEAADQYWGGPGDDVLDDPAGGGNVFDGGAGNDDIDGGSESMRDVLDYGDRVNPVHVDLAAGVGGEPGESDVIANVQDIQGGFGDDNLVGNDHDNWINGNGGFDTIAGGGGNDMCVGEVLSAC
jgi:serralysin